MQLYGYLVRLLHLRSFAPCFPSFDPPVFTSSVGRRGSHSEWKGRNASGGREEEKAKKKEGRGGRSEPHCALGRNMVRPPMSKLGSSLIKEGRLGWISPIPISS